MEMKRAHNSQSQSDRHRNGTVCDVFIIHWKKCFFNDCIL